MSAETSPDGAPDHGKLIFWRTLENRSPKQTQEGNGLEQNYYIKMRQNSSRANLFFKLSGTKWFVTVMFAITRRLTGRRDEYLHFYSLGRYEKRAEIINQPDLIILQAHHAFIFNSLSAYSIY